MKKIVIHCTTSQVGTDSWEFFEVKDSVTDRELDGLASACADANAEMYGLYHPCEGYPEDDDSIDEDIDGYWELYDSEKHDQHTRTGIPDWLVP